MSARLRLEQENENAMTPHSPDPNWTGIAPLIRACHETMRKSPLPLRAMPPREAAAAVAIATWGRERAIDLPELINIAMLAVQMPRLAVHELRGRVPAVVDETDLHSLPDEPPGLLRAPWLLEVRTPGPESLFPTGSDSACCSLGGYELEGTYYLVGLDYPDGATVVRWRPTWSGGELEAGVVVERDTSLLGGIDAADHAAWGAAAARFSVVLGLLLDAEGAPLRTSEDGPSLPRSRPGKGGAARPWITRRVYLVEGPGERGGAPAGGAAGTRDLVPTRAEVRGHLKRQRHGPGRAETKWIYVASYEARRWVAPRPVRTIVT